METDGLQERLLRFDKVMESPCYYQFKFAQDYMKFVMCILLFIRASREGHWNLHLEFSRLWHGISLLKAG